MSRGSDDATGIKATQCVATEHSPKFEITERHIPEQSWNDHANYFAAFEDDDDETVAASNISEGYLDEANIGMESGIPTKHDETPAHILRTTTSRCVTQIVRNRNRPTRWSHQFFFRTADGRKVLGIPCDTTRTPGAAKCRHYFQYHETEARRGVCHIRLWSHMAFFSARSTSSEPGDC
jgi:hypothetical protein